MLAPLRPPEEETWRMDDGYDVHGYVHVPPSEPQAILIYLHGIQSHGGWYQHSASLLAEAGNVVLQPDRRGSGRNEAARGDARSGEVWLDDVDAVYRCAAARWGHRPFGLVGVSWGGKLAPAYAASARSPVRGCLLIAPGIFPRVTLPMRQKMRIVSSWMARRRDGFEIPLDDPSLFTENTAGQEFIASDPLRLTHATARFLVNSNRMDRQVQKIRSLDGVRLQTLLAQEDAIIDNDQTKAWTERLGGEVKVLAGRHTLEFNQDPQAFQDAVTTWGRTWYVD